MSSRQIKNPFPRDTDAHRIWEYDRANLSRYEREGADDAEALATSWDEWKRGNLASDDAEHYDDVFEDGFPEDPPNNPHVRFTPEYDAYLIGWKRFVEEEIR